MRILKVISVPDFPPTGVLVARIWSRLTDITIALKVFPIIVGLILGISVAYAAETGAWYVVPLVIIGAPMLFLIIRYPVATIPLWMLVSPLFTQTASRYGRYMFWVTQRMILPVGLGLFILSYLAKARKAHSMHFSLAEVTMAIFAILVPISVLITQDSVEAPLINYYDRILMPFCMYLFIRLITQRGLEIRKLIPIAFVLVGIQLAVGLLSWNFPQLIPSQWMNWQGTRSSGTLTDPAVYSSVLIFGMGLLFHAAVNRKPGFLRSIFLITFGLGIAGIFLTLTRGSWLGGLSVLLGMLILYPKITLRIIAIVLLVAVILGGTILSNQFANASRRLTTVNTVQSRMEVSKALITMTSIKPIFGWGYETERLYSRQFIENITMVDTPSLSSHNTYLTIMAEMGLVGFSLYIFPFAYWLVRSIKVLPKLPKNGFTSRFLLVVLWLIILHHFIVSNFMDMRFFPFGLTLLWLTLGLIANLVVSHQDNYAIDNFSYVLTNG